MREYGSVSPHFWIGKTGKKLRGNMEAQLLALYLMTCPHANMIGVFHCPVMYMAHETGIPLEGASKALQCLIDEGFCMYDEDSETVFVIRMAAHQVGDTLKPGDKRVLGVQKEVAKVAVPLLRDAFLSEYAEAYGLKNEVENKPLPSPFDAPPKQLTGTGQEQEQEQGASGKPQPESKSSEASAPSAYGLCSKAMRKAGMFDASPDHPEFRQLVEAGVSSDEFASAAAEAVSRGKGFAYALATVRGRREDAARKGALPAAPDAQAERMSKFAGAL